MFAPARGRFASQRSVTRTAPSPHGKGAAGVPGSSTQPGCFRPAGVDQKLNVVPTLNMRPCMIRVGASQDGPNVVVQESAASVLKKL